MTRLHSLGATLAVLVWLGACPALAANVLVVSDNMQDQEIAAVLTADGHSVTMVTNDEMSDCSNTVLGGSGLDAYDVIFWSGGGRPCYGHAAATIDNLRPWVEDGGYLFYTGYDSTLSESFLPGLLGFATGNDQVGVPPSAIASIDDALTTGVTDVRGVTPSDGYTDRDCMSGALAGAVILATSSGRPDCAQWSLFPIGAGYSAWVSNGRYSGAEPSWANPSSAFNGAIRNFASAADASSGVCTGTVEGGMCTSSRGTPGSCHGGRCCTGCWDGSVCRRGDQPATCGISGGACVRCAAVAYCASAMCNAGVCSGSPCDDGQGCTADTCDEATDTCAHTYVGGCIVGGECVGVGEHHVAYPCLVCDPARSDVDWSTEATGTPCQDARCEGGHLFSAGTCDAMGTCDAPRASACASLSCADRTTCEPTCTATSCPSGERCGAALHCVPVVALGSTCTDDGECDSNACADGVCCETACLGTCMACDLPGREGMCRPLSAGTDPSSECGAGGACDGHGACAMRARDAGSTPSDASMDAATRTDGGAVVVPPMGGCSAHGRGEASGWALAAIVAFLVSRRRAW